MKNLIYVVISFTLLLCACENRPKNVLSRSEMEEVLFDYHIAQGLIERLPVDEREGKAKDYINAVFEKHGICEADFDSSVVYYNRHTKDLYKIYSSLNDRYQALNEKLQLENGNNDMTTIFIEGGDTTNIWNASKLIMLRNKDLLSHESFTIHADSTFHQHDEFIMRLTPILIDELQGANRDLQLYVGLNIKYKNGKSTGVTRQYNYPGKQQFSIKATEDSDIKSISGYFFYKGRKGARNICFVDDIALIRMHELEKKQEEENTDSIKNDSIVKDTVTLESPARRLTPEEIRRENSTGKSIKIQTAPDIRRPNSIGPRRRRPAVASPNR